MVLGSMGSYPPALALFLVIFIPGFVFGVGCDELVRRNPYEFSIRIKQESDGGRVDK